MTDVGVKDKESRSAPAFTEESRGHGFSRLVRFLSNLPVFGAVLFIFVTTFPPFEVATEINLPVHMLQHIIIVIGGVLIGYPLYKSGRLARLKNPRLAVLGIFVVGGLLVFWHLPALWDAAVENVGVHIVEHFCFLLIGVLIGFGVPQLQDNLKMILLALTISAHMFYGFALYLITTPVYPLYPVAQQQLLGIALFAPAPVYFIGYLYLNLTRENRRLEALEAGPQILSSPTKSYRKMILPSLSILMIAVLVIYFVVTGAVILTAHSPQSSTISIIYIQETPVSWQYSPQVIHVILGVNNTVEWQSHSFTFDTVTSSTGLFSSGSLGPGSSYSYTFTQPGVYHYYCQYHLWMNGEVIVENS
jgi:plastocyanin